MTHSFANVPKAKIQRSRFDRSHTYSTAFNSGYLIPFFADEALPGDTFTLNTTALVRLATQIVPVMDNVYFDTHFFAVPYRLVWDNFQKFMGERKNPEDSIDYLVPEITNKWEFGSLGDYFGIRPNVDLTVDSLFFRAYNLIYNEWFRDENLIDSVPVPTGDGPDNPDDFVLLKRGKRHDYFTSALPWPQKGPGVELPLGDFAPVDGIYLSSLDTATATDDTFYGVNGQVTDSRPAVAIANQDGNTKRVRIATETTGAVGADNLPQVSVDLSSATAVTINTMRQAFQLQRMLERDARGGTRYTEIIRSHFSVVSPDARLQRPEYLGGHSMPFIVSPVAQTSASNTTTPQANLSAFAVATGNGAGFKHSFTEHCLIIGLCSVRADLTYQQGVNRMWRRRTRYDFYWPSLAHLGEQEVKNSEIYAQGTDDDDGIFGYQERYAEYRYKPSMITGILRSDAPQSLDVWHLSQDFGNLPTLSQDFIEENPPIERIVAVQDEPQFILNCKFDLLCDRPMPVYGVPGLIDHF